MEKSLFDFVYGCGCDIEFAFDKARELQNIIDAEAEKRAKEKEESLFNAHKEEFQLEVLEQLQKDGIRKAGMELSSTSPLISEKFTVNGVTLYASDYIPDSVIIDPVYEDNILVKNQYSVEYQEINNKNGKRKFAWKETPTLVLISNPTAAGKCENVVCYLKGNPKPLVFPNGEITLEAFRRQTTFARKGINISVHKQYESFLRSLRECPQKKFLTIPKLAGGITLPNGVTMYISSEFVISGLEDLFPTEVREHTMAVHPLSLEDMSTIYSKAIPNSIDAKLLTTVRINSILLPLFEAEGFNSNRGFVISYSNDTVRETNIVLTKRKNYTSTVVQALTDRISKVRKELAAANDVTVLLTFSGIFEEGHNLDNAFKAVMWDITGENGVEDNVIKLRKRKKVTGTVKVSVTFIMKIFMNRM